MDHMDMMDMEPATSGAEDEKKEEIKDRLAAFRHFQVAGKMRPAIGKGAEDAQCNINGYFLDLSDLPKMVYSYHISIINISDRKERDLSRGGKSDFAVQTRRRACHRLFDILRKKYLSRYDAPTLLYDGGNIFYSRNHVDEIPDDIKPIIVSEDNIIDYVEFVVEKEDKLIKDDSYIPTYLSKNCKQIIFRLKPTGPVTLNLKGSEEEIKNTTHFVELLTSAEVNYRERHYQFKNKAYDKDGGRDEKKIVEGKLVKPGLVKSCRVVGVGEHQQPTAMLQIAPKKSPFFQGLPMIKFLCEFLKCDDRGLERALQQRRGAALANTQIKDLWVRTTHLDQNRDIVVKGLAKTNAYDTTFLNKDEVEQSVYDYFEIEKKMALRFPNLPLVIQSKGDSVAYFPMECLKIRDGQRVTTAKATPTLSEQMIKSCQIRPCEMVEMIADQMKKAKLTDGRESGNNYLDAFGVRISSRPVAASGKRLHPPAIKYGGSTVEPRGANLQWGKLNPKERFFKPAKQDKTIYIISFNGCVDSREAYHFVEKLCSTGYNCGMKMNAKDSEYKDMSSEDSYALDKQIRDWSKKASLILAITRDKLDPVHDTLKLLEAKYNVVTQHVSQQTMKKAIGQQGAFMVLGNLIMKTNLKMGGVNFELGASQDLMRKPEMARTELFPKKRMYFGFDVSHAGPQTFAERKLGVVQSEPSVVGMSYTLSSATEVRGTYWMQKPGLANITMIKSQVVTALENFLDHNKYLPEDIVVYRGGVSEGEFQMVVKEMTDFSEAFAEVRDPRSSRRYNPSLTCIVVCTSSNYRIFPKVINNKDSAPFQNVRPGTVIDSEITHPDYSEFILVPQKALQGTARPIRCTVVYTHQGDSGRVMDMDQIELVTNALCYGHQVVCGSTGVPSLCYAATNLTKRGRNVWKADNYADSDAGTVTSGGSSSGKWKHDGSTDFFEQMSQALAPKVDAHYWA